MRPARFWTWIAAGIALTLAGCGGDDPSRPAPTRQIELGTSRLIKFGEYRLREGEDLPGDAYLWASRVRFNGTSQGDVWSLTRDLEVTGEVGRDLAVIADTVEVPGKVAGRLRTFGRQVTIGGEIGGPALLGGYHVHLDSHSKIQGPLAVFAGRTEVFGRVEGPAHLEGGTVFINGTITGEVTVDCDVLTLGPRSKINGKLTYTARQEVTVPNNAVDGAVIWIAREPFSKPLLAGLRFRFGFGFYLGVVSLVAGLLLTVFFRPMVDGALFRIETVPELAISFGIGLVALLAMLMVGLICCLLFPLALAVWSALGALVFFGGLLGKMALGLWVLHWRHQSRIGPVPGLLVGIGITFLCGLVPILGELVWFLVSVTGMGALLIQIREGNGNSTIQTVAS